MKKILLFFLGLLCACASMARQHAITGTVLSSADGLPLAGVNVIVKGTTQGTTTDGEGRFTIEASEKATLVFSFIGFHPLEIVAGDEPDLKIRMVEDIATLKEITIVATGYQFLPKERANGSYAHIDNALVNRRVGTDILSRLEDVTSGLIMNRNVPGKKNDISIRGLSTINSATKPLIVIDNFPYEGDMNTINPNDVETITVLKDAAAASIWGARAGNGVIVITTKKGGYGQPLKVSLNSNVTVGARPDLFYNPLMTSAQVIENEQRLFNTGFYAARESSYSAALTPAVELMILNRDGQLSDADLAARLSALGTHDVRSDYENYLNQTSINQQYALSLSAGTHTHRYLFSAGWDKNRDNLVGNQYERMTLNMSNSWNLLKDRLTATAAMYYSLHHTQANNIGQTADYAYARLKDENGNHLPITKNYREAFIANAQKKGLLNWQYVPLDELNSQSNVTALTDYRINATVNYKVLEGLNAQVLYQYWNAQTAMRNRRNEDSYFARDLINSFSSLSGTTVIRRVPLGGVVDMTSRVSESQSVRGQVNYARDVGSHSIYVLSGYEVREQNTDAANTRHYGYNDELASITSVNYVTAYPMYYFPDNTMRIPFADYQTSMTDRFISQYANATYTYRSRYSLSGSARRDQSNLFGVRTNQRAVPLWSAGLGWTLSEEHFVRIAWLPYLKLRATYGANGNVNKQVSAFTTAYSRGTNYDTGMPYSVITNPANPDLRWEKIRSANAGVDFELKNRRLTGSLEYFNKYAYDLIGTRVFPSSTGVAQFTGNFASMRTMGMDVVLNSINVNGPLRWTTHLLLSTNRERVTSYDTEPTANSLLVNGSGQFGTVAPLTGKPLLAIYSYQWAGLDPLNGNPKGYLDGVPSADVAAIVSTATPQSLTYHGSARPATYGSVRNTLSWKQLSLSFNISYRLGYYIRNTSVYYSQLFNGERGHADYARRWQQPGDEAFTSVPSLPASVNYNRDNFYTYSDVLVQRGDHFRLQDINLTYQLDRALIHKLPVSRIELYSYINNIGILWKASSGPLDPDYLTARPQRTIAIGARIDF